MATNIHEVIKTALTDDLREKLWAYAYRIISGQEWPGGIDARDLASDIVSDAVCKTLAGDRVWNIEKTETIEGFLKSTIKSLISNLHRDASQAAWISVIDDEIAEAINDNQRSSTEILETDEFFYGVMAQAGDDEIAIIVLSKFEEEFSRKDIIEKTNLTQPEVDAAKKRLKRYANAYLKSQKEPLANG